MPPKKDSEALERKLRQVYDAFDSRNFKVHSSFPAASALASLYFHKERFDLPLCSLL
jgi:hypothetical protein